MRIVFNQPSGDLYGPQIIELMNILSDLRNSQDHEIVFDYSNITFASPLLTLSVAALINKLRLKGINASIINKRLEYLSVIHFENGLSVDEENLTTVLNSSNYKTYLPILQFPTSKDEASVVLRNRIITALNQLIRVQTGLNAQAYQPISYLISEITDNISDHSGERIGWLYAQCYQNAGYIDICIVDTGKTILGSYRDHFLPGILTHLDALQNALQGKSTKGKERGRGIPTSHRVVIEGLGGKIGIISGNAILKNTEIALLPEEWPGTIFAIRIPTYPTNFDFYRLIE